MLWISRQNYFSIKIYIETKHRDRERERHTDKETQRHIDCNINFVFFSAYIACLQLDLEKEGDRKKDRQIDRKTQTL